MKNSNDHLKKLQYNLKVYIFICMMTKIAPGAIYWLNCIFPILILNLARLDGLD